MHGGESAKESTVVCRLMIIMALDLLHEYLDGSPLFSPRIDGTFY